MIVQCEVCGVIFWCPDDEKTFDTICEDCEWVDRMDEYGGDTAA